MKTTNRLILAVAAIMATCTIHNVAAAVITWQSVQNIVGPSDVDTTGTLFGAFNFGTGGNLTVNGVNFANDPSIGAPAPFGSISAVSPSFYGIPPYLGYPIGVTDANYQALLLSGWQGNGNSNFTLSGLTAGSSYKVQIWVSGVWNAPTGRTETINGSPVLSLDIGQFVIGTFTADIGGTQQFNFVSSTYPVVNAMQIRDAVPEPTSVCLLGLGALVLVMRRFRKA